MDLIGLLDELSIPYRREGQHEHARYGWVQVDCPWCSARSKRFRLGINISQLYANCWACGYKQLASVLSELTGEGRGKCREWLNRLPRTREHTEKRPVSAARVQIPSCVRPLSGAHRRYLYKRGFEPDDLVRLWGVQGIGLASELGWRLWIPIYRHGELVSWTSRSIGDGKAGRYISAPPGLEVVHLRNLLYGADYARHAIVICEGPTDVWRMGPGAVALLGLNCSEPQLELMTRYPLRAICFDTERFAQQRAHSLASKLRGFPGETYVVQLETGGDVADADQSEVDEIRATFLEERV